MWGFIYILTETYFSYTRAVSLTIYIGMLVLALTNRLYEEKKSCITPSLPIGSVVEIKKVLVSSAIVCLFVRLFVRLFVCQIVSII